MRAEPDVRAEVRLPPDPPSNRRAGRNHHRWRNRISVLPTNHRVVPRRHPAGIFDVHGEGSPRLHAPQRDVEILQLGYCGGLLRSALSKSGVALEHDPEKWAPVFRKDYAQTER